MDKLLLPLIAALTAAALPSAGFAQTSADPQSSQAPQPVLYVVGYAHLDTQWRWCYPMTIRDYLSATLHDNFRLFELYPDYIFNFSGANRYRMMREYYPADYETLKRYIAAGRWFPCGSSMEECDVNTVSAESIIRQVLYGNHYFQREFGVASEEFMLPDCFGFPASLPSILAHCGLKGFSTQKLSWGSANGIPFNVGVWVGPDGNSIVSALNPGSYGGKIEDDLSHSEAWLKRIDEDGAASGVYDDYMYYGTGDMGGAPAEDSVKWLEQSLHGGGPVKVISAKADQMFRDIPPEQVPGLPRYQGDLLLTEHSAGSITSQAYMKRWNHLNELLADSAERAAVTADFLQGQAYPKLKLNNAWTLVMGGQFHDILPGTSHPKAYEYSQNDEVLALNQFADVLEQSVGAVAAGMDTQVEGEALVVYNPLSIAREDVVQATVSFPDGVPPAVQVLGPDSIAVPAQIVDAGTDEADVLFLAKVQPVSNSVYDVRGAATISDQDSELKVSETGLENARYRVSLDANGDIASVFDKQLGRELLSAPARLAFTHDDPGYWPAWNIDWEDQQQPPYAYVEGPAQVRVVERGPARVALEVKRQAGDSTITQTLRLSAGGAGNRVEVDCQIDWRGKDCNFKAVFPLTAANPQATYSWEAGTVQRGNNDPKKYEVPAHQWFDLTDTSGEFGVTVLCPFKFGSDKPDDNTLRLTLLRTPGVNMEDYADQAHQDWGRHHITYGLAGHAGDWREGRNYWEAYRLEQPLTAFSCSRHAGLLGPELSLLQIDSQQVRVLALKQAEDSNEVILRMVELAGQQAPVVNVSFMQDIASARELNGQEEHTGPAEITDGDHWLRTSFAPYQIRTFAIALAPPSEMEQSYALTPPAPNYAPVALPYDTAVASMDGEASTAGFDGAGGCLAAEMLPQLLGDAGVTFELAPGGNGQANAVTCRGQQISLPPGLFNRVYLLAAASSTVEGAEFLVDGAPVRLTIQDWSGYIGQWDTRLWEGDIPEEAFVWPYKYAGLAPGYIKRDPVAWYCSHRHDAAGRNLYYDYSYLFRYAIDIPVGTQTLTLPNNEQVKLLALSAAKVSDPSFQPAQPLYDTLAGE